MTTRTALIENEYANLWYYPEEGIVHHQFLRPVENEEFQSVLRTGLRLMHEHGAQKWLSDDRKNSILLAEDSAWSQDFWLPRAYQRRLEILGGAATGQGAWPDKHEAAHRVCRRTTPGRHQALLRP